MPKTKVIKTLQTGLGLAIGLVIANAVIVPLVSNRTPMAGLCIGFIAGFLALIVYIFIAISQRRSDPNQ